MNDEILDIEESNNYESRVASKGTRFGNLFLDSLIVGLPTSFMSNYIVYGTFYQARSSRLAVDDQFNTILLNYLFLVIYYILMEHYTGKTLGKMITKTRVVNHNGEKPLKIAVFTSNGDVSTILPQLPLF